MASTDAKTFPAKNVAYRVTFPIYDSTGSLVTGAAGLDSEVSKDGGTFADCTNEASEIASASGLYYLDLTATEMNADTVAIIVKTSTTGAKTTVLILYPDAANNVADALLNRDMATGTDSGTSTIRTVRQALRFLRNKWTLTSTTLSVKKEDDTTESWTATVTTDGAAAPIIGNDPAG